MKVYEGTILTVDACDSVARYLVEDAGIIAYVGDTLPAQFEGAPIERLQSRALCPAFVDTHEHLASFATFNAGLNVMHARSNERIKEMVADFARTCTAKILVAFGASPYSVEEGRLLSRAELDEACPNKPVFMVKYDGHACVVNSALLEKIDGKVCNLRGYHPDTGEMNQEAFFCRERLHHGHFANPGIGEKHSGRHGFSGESRHWHGSYRERRGLCGKPGHQFGEMGGKKRPVGVSGARISSIHGCERRYEARFASDWWMLRMRAGRVFREP